MDTGVFTYDTPNLGDEMQAFAALAHLERVSTFIDRDRMADFDRHEPTTCIFNAWFGRGNDFRPPSEHIRPVWHGFTGKEELLDSPWLPYMAERGPVGCRDLMTTELLVERGVNAYWSGCLTLFLGEALGWAPRAREGVLFVDVPLEAEGFIPPEIVRRATRASTFPPPSILRKPLERWATVARIADQLSRAELVVTRRLHVALPAASFGTPVVAIPDAEISFARRRFSGVESIIPTVFLDRVAIDLNRLDWRNVVPPRVPDQLTHRYAVLREALEADGVADRGGQRSPLDDLARSTQRIVNADRIHKPGRIKLRLDHREFELDVRFWSDRYIDVGLTGFPGLSKFAFDVYVSKADNDTWIRFGALSELVRESGCQ
jgi:hypothetical protein